jgi:hypothetical protein
MNNGSNNIPKPLADLYKRALLFLDRNSTVQDHYWAVGIIKAITKAYPQEFEKQSPE